MDLGLDGADVFAEQAKEEQLHGTEEEDADQDRRRAQLEVLPEQQFGGEVAHGNQQADACKIREVSVFSAEGACYSRRGYMSSAVNNESRLLSRMLVAYAIAVLLLVALSARLWWQSPMDLIAHEFDYFLGLFASSGENESKQWAAIGRLLHFGGFLVVGLLYLAIVGRFVREPEALSKGRIAGYAALVPLIFAAGMPWVSPDVFFYIGKGWEESHYGVSPYLIPINQLPGYQNDQMFANIFPGFLNTATGYGPIVQKVAELIAALSGGNEKLALALHKVVNLGLHGACSMLVYRLAPEKFARVAALSYAINPLICFSVLTCAHNDHWMNMFMLLALLALSRRRWAWAGAAVGAAFGVKYFPLVYMPILGLAALMQKGEGMGLAQRLSDAARLVIGFIATSVASFLIFYPEALPDLAGTLSSGGASVYRNSIYHFANVLSAVVVPSIFGSEAFLLSRQYMIDMGMSLRAVYIIIYVISLLLLLRRMRDDIFNGSVSACLGVTILYFIIANASNQEWYMTWLMGFALILPYKHAYSLAWRLSAFFLPLVIYTVKSDTIIAWLYSNTALYLLVLALGCRYLWCSRSDSGKVA